METVMHNEEVKGMRREPRVRVMVVDDQRLMRDGIASLLSIQEGIEIVGTAATGQQALELADDRVSPHERTRFPAIPRRGSHDFQGARAPPSPSNHWG